MKIKRLHIIRLFAFLLLLIAGGTANEAWADVTYIILTKPFNVRNYNNTDNFRTGVRVEALRCTSTGTLVYLPDNFRSPLAKNFKYYTSKESTYASLYDTGHSTRILATKYDIYTAVSGEVTENSAVGANTVFYVTYDYINDGESSGYKNGILELDDNTTYTIAMNTGNNLRYLCYNRSRNNRPAAANASTQKDGQKAFNGGVLASDDFLPFGDIAPGFKWDTYGPKDLYFQFKFEGTDPYNVVVKTGYDKDDTYTEELAIEKNKKYKKPYRGAAIFSKINNNTTVDKLATEEKLWFAVDIDQHYKSSSVVEYDEWPGFYRGDLNPVLNAFAILPHSSGDGYVLMASKLNLEGKNHQPLADGSYAYLMDGNYNPSIYFKAAANAVTTHFYPIKTYTFNITTPFGNVLSATAKWSDADKDATIESSHVPSSLRRKYCSYVGFYKDAALTQAITKYSDVPASGNIYVKYEVSGAPFTAISPSADYTTATWYELTDKDSSKKRIRWDSSASEFQNNGSEDYSKPEHEKASEFAFMGDPYELRIIHRSLSESAKANQYVGSSSAPSASTKLSYGSTRDATGFKWEIPYDNDAKVNTFELKQFNTDNAYWYWSSDPNSVVYYNTTSTRVKVLELPKYTYTYNVVDLAGNIAIKAEVEQPIFTPLSGYASIPATIRSPFLADETITYYGSYTDRNGDEKINRLDWHNDTGGASEQDDIKDTPPTNNANIYVSYTTTELSSKSIQLIYSEQFNVKLNGEYIYWDDTTNKILSENLATDDAKLETTPYLWHLRGRDPYCMRIDNKGYSEQEFGIPASTTTAYMYNPIGDGTYTDGSPESIANGMFVRVKDDTWGNDKELEFVNNRINASRFIAMMGGYAGVYEVLAATGTTDLYHIGRASTEGAETKIYSIDTEHGGYAHGADQLRFELAGETVITYTLVDKAKDELFTVTSTNPRLALPSEYQSPLVDTYYYYPTKDKAETDNHSNNITEIAQDDDNDAADDNHVWVTYTVNDNVKFNTASNTTKNPYLLRFHNGKSYHLEDGSDKLTTGDKIKAMYPYTNGDGNLNVYGEAMRDEQMNGGTNTRSRWQWFFESANSDPYHVKIHSKNQITTSLGKDYVYLRTYAVHFNQDASASTTHIVTGSTLPGVWKAATEYMVLGTAGNYKLMTTQAVPIDLNGDGDTSDAGESAGERQYVKSFEQYWKTYDMIKKHLLNITTDEYSEDPTTFVMPSTKWSDLKTALTTKGVNNEEDLNYIDGSNWHSYSIVANAKRWNGYDDKGKDSKKVEELEHWFQSFDMGDGTFTIENGEVPPVLVLLDRHGWEIMRKPIPTGSSDPEAEAKLAALKVFDSPMVKEYKFYNNANKVSNCHKFHLRMQNGAERDPIMVGGVQFTSTSLGTLPPYVADRDLFVTYTVKEEYEKSYRYSFTDNGGDSYTESGTPSEFIVLQNHHYASDESSTLTANSAPINLSDAIIADADKAEGSKTFQQKCLWYLQPNLDIDDEMGIPRPWRDSGDPDTYYNEKETKALFKDKTGFDPYNLQLKNVSTNKFFTIDMKKSILSGGVYTGDYEGGGSLNVTLAAATDAEHAVSSPESYDHSTLKMTNQTFMAVQDENGNMQLMPRFDHSSRINAFVALTTPDDTQTNKHSVDDPTPGEQTTFLVRPQVFDYKVIDNQGNVALRYKTGGEFYPSMPAHFKSPLAEDFKFYKTLTDSNSDGVYEMASLADEIISSFAAAGIQNSSDIYIRYSYNENFDSENQNILQGEWLTMSLGGSDVQASGTLNASTGEGVSLYGTTKPATAEALKAAKQWQWKFLQSPVASSSSLYIAPDPYCVTISNRQANNDNPMASPSKMAKAIKVSGKEKFVILSHPSGDYALCAAGDGLTYSFLNGDGMTTPDAGTPKAASVKSEGSFTKTSNTISDDARIIFTEDITHTYTYYIINNSSKLAASDKQDEETAQSNYFKPVVPYNIQSPLINDDDYLYYATAKISGDTYTIDSDVEKFIIDNLYGLYDDDIYVRYPTFNRDNTPYMVPNERNSSSPVAVGSGSNEVAIDINGNLPYNIIWLSDNMMKSTDGTITDGETNSYNLSGETADKWHFTGNDPYAIKIKHDSGGDKYVNGDETLVAAESAKSYMLLKREGFEDFGVFAETGNQGTMLTFSGSPSKTLTTTTSDPVKFIPFALSVHHLIYHLVINTSKASTNIPYREGDEETYQTSGSWIDQVTSIPGTTQRDLTTTTTVTGDTYQLGETITLGANSVTYCYDAGKVSLGDILEVPEVFKRPNCRYYYYVQDIYDNYDGSTKTCSTLNTTLNNKYKGLKMDDDTPVFIKKSDLIGKTVVVNITYSFDAGLPTNAGDGFVTDVDQNLWYTFETNETTPYLAHYTNAWGLQAMRGRETRYTNDYLWLPLGDPYGFKMYNRYIKKNSLTTGDDNTRMMTSTAVNVEGRKLLMGTPGASITEDEESRTLTAGNEVYELLASNTDGYFRVHPVINNSGTQYFIRKDPSDDYAKLSTTATEWRFGLSPELIQPYIDRINYVGGLKSTVAKSTDFGVNHINVKNLITALEEGTATAAQLMNLQSIVYDVGNIVEFTSGYYRLHNQPDVSNISPVRYASGYLHDIEKTQNVGFFQKTASDAADVVSKSNTLRNIGDYYFNVNNGASYEKVTVTVAYDGETNATHNASSHDGSSESAWLAAGGMPMHFYSKKGVKGSFTGDSNPLTSGFTESNATRGDIPIPATEYDPSSIFYINGSVSANKTISTATLSTQGLNVVENRMTTSAGQTFTMMDLGSGVFLIHDGSAPATRMYLNFDQSSDKDYDLKYYHEAPTDDAKWCLEPANNQGLLIETHSGGDGYYYSTFCAPYDVTLPADDGEKTYNAYVCTAWDTEIIHPTSIGKTITKGTPAIIRTKDTSGSVKVTLPGTASSSASCVFTGKYLEQLLATAITAEDKVYTFGLPITGYNLTITPAGGFVNGEVNNVVEGSDPAHTGVGFYLNATTNKEKDAATAHWTPNNRYVLHNKIYYRTGSSGSSARGMTRSSIDFVPVVFDDLLVEPEEYGGEEKKEEELTERREYVGDGCVYDMQGRRVATEEQVFDGTWKQRVSPGIYIINGKKISVN